MRGIIVYSVGFIFLFSCNASCSAADSEGEGECEGVVFVCFCLSAANACSKREALPSIGGAGSKGNEGVGISLFSFGPAFFEMASKPQAASRS